LIFPTCDNVFDFFSLLRGGIPAPVCDGVFHNVGTVRCCVLPVKKKDQSGSIFFVLLCKFDENKTPV
jgi:hypothetical protein